MALIEASMSLTLTMNASIRTEAPHAAITAQVVTGDAPLPVFVHARLSGFQYQDIYTAYFIWDFGEPGSAHNTKEGAGIFNCAHVYETAGSYTITCTMIENDGAGGEVTDSATQVITVNAFNGTTYYVKTGGSDLDTGLDDEHAWETYDYAVAQIAAADTRILFKRGDTFTANTRTISTNGSITQPIILGAYGSGADPIIENNDAVDLIVSDGDYLRIVDLSFSWIGSSGARRVVDSNADGFLALRCSVNNFTIAFTTGTGTSINVNDIFIVDCTITNSVGTPLGLTGRRLALLGTTVSDTTSHCCRVFSVDGMYLADCDIQRSGTGVYALKLHCESFITTGEKSQFIVIVDSTFRGWGAAVVIAPQATTATYNEPIENVVLERNKILPLASGVTGHGIQICARNVYIRNNLLFGNIGTLGVDTWWAVYIRDYYPYNSTPIPGNIYIIGNSAYDETKYGSTGDKTFVYITTDDVFGVVIKSNVFHGINSTGTSGTQFLRCAGGPMRSEIVEENNNLYILPADKYKWVREGGDSYTLAAWQGFGEGTGSHDDRDPKFTAPATYDLTLQPDSPCIDDGIYVSGLWNDYDGNRRVLTGALDMGAYEWQAVKYGYADLDFDLTMEANLIDGAEEEAVPVYGEADMSFSLTMLGTLYGIVHGSVEMDTDLTMEADIFDGYINPLDSDGLLPDDPREDVAGKAVMRSATVAKAAASATTTVCSYRVDSHAAWAWAVFTVPENLTVVGKVDLQISPDNTNWIKHTQFESGLSALTFVTHTGIPNAAPYIRFQASGGTGATYTVTAMLVEIADVQQ